MLKENPISFLPYFALSWITVGCLHPIEWDNETWNDNTEEEGMGSGSTGTGEESTEDEDKAITALCYEILGVSSGASVNDIKKAYHKLLLQYHPDKNKKLEAIKITMALHQAYKLLDPSNSTELDKSNPKQVIKDLQEGLKLLNEEKAAEEVVEEEEVAASEEDEGGIGDID